VLITYFVKAHIWPVPLLASVVRKKRYASSILVCAWTTFPIVHGIGSLERPFDY
jgi:hypothetical protein